VSDAVNYVDAKASAVWTSADSSAASLTVTQPDGTALAVAPTVTDAGAAHTAVFIPVLPGRHVLRWVAGDDTFVDILDVWPSAPRYLVSRERAIERLQQTNNSAGTAFDAIMLYIAAASAVVESIVGPMFTTEETWSEVSAYGSSSVVLPHCDITVSAVSIDGSDIDASAYTVDDPAGIVWVDLGRRAKVTVTYVVGTAQVPIPAQMGCLEIIAHSWQQTRQSIQPWSDDSTQTVITSMGYAIPRRALEWLQAVPRAAGAA